MKYRKKPIVIDAVQYTGDNYYELKEWIGQPCNPVVGRNATFFINTLEGEHVASLGDYIIQGIAGEFYPCKPDIFEQTYEKVDDCNSTIGLFDKDLVDRASTLIRVGARISKRVPQSVYLIEEMSELTKELTKDQRLKGDIEHIKEEIADVLCTLLTYSSSINLDFNEVRDIVMRKFDRGIERLTNNEQ